MAKRDLLVTVKGVNTKSSVELPRIDVVVFDMSHLTFNRSGASVSVASPFTGEIVRTVVDVQASAREAVFRALDRALELAALPGAEGLSKVGLFNPHTGQVAVGPIPRTAVFQMPQGVSVPVFGRLTSVVWDEGGSPCDWVDVSSGPSVMLLDACVVPRLQADMASTMRALSSH